MTDLLCLQDSYMKECEAMVTYADDKSVVLDKTVLYPQGGGQPTDTGRIARLQDDAEFIVTLVAKKEGHIVHTVDKTGLAVGDKVRVTLDWERRHKIMRMHTAAHLLSAIGSKELKLMITGNQLGTDKSRMDFNLEHCDKMIMQGIVDKANDCIAEGAPVSISYLPKEEAMKIPSIVKLAGALPPNIPVLRIITIGDPASPLDQQADGGTHVNDIKEIGKIALISVDNKGKDNRRMYFAVEG